MPARSALLIALILIAVVVNFLSFKGGQDWGDDFSGYVLQAQAIASGDFTNLNTHLAQTDYMLIYPWGFPLVLAPVIKFFAVHLLFIKIYIFLFYLASLILVYFLFRPDKENLLPALLLTAASPYFWQFKNYLLADFPNLCFVLCSLLVIERVVIQRKTIVNAYFSGFIVGLFIFLAFIMRNQSFVLLPTLAVVQLMQYRRNVLRLSLLPQLLTPYAVFFALSFSFSLLFPVKAFNYSKAYEHMSWVSTIWDNLFYYANIWVELFGDIMILGNIASIFTGFALTFFIIGISSGAKNNILYLAFFAFSIGLVLVSPFYQGIRYLLPTIPLFFYFMVRGLRHGLDRVYPKRGQTAGYLVAVCLGILSLGSIARYSYGVRKTGEIMEGPYTPQALRMFDYLKANTGQQDIIGFWKPRAMLLYTGRNGVVPLTYDDFAARKVNYYVYCKTARQDQVSLEAIQQHPAELVNVYENEKFYVFKLVR